jgi:FAD/FMN-containing dehydrogenase
MMRALVETLSKSLPARQVITDSLRRLAYGTDASFYRMIPEVVAVDDNDVQALMRACQAQGHPVTFRAAGTSLSGQAVTDSVVALIGEGFATCEIGSDGKTVRVGPGIKLRALLQACVAEIVEPAGVTCCGFGGDRGFVVPELNTHALRKVHEGLPKNCCEGVSTNRTCEIGLTAETGRPYRSIAYLLEECTREDAVMNC